MAKKAGNQQPVFVNRELSWLEFNRRVLDEGCDAETPPLERLKFLAITSSNLDEFFKVRVGGLQLISREGRRGKDVSGMTPQQQLTAISRRAHDMVTSQYAYFLDTLEPELAAAGIIRRRPEALNEIQLAHVQRVVQELIFPVITPQVIDAPSEFPLLPDLQLCMAVRLKRKNASSKSRVALMPFGPSLDRFYTLPSEGRYEYILMEDMMRLFIDAWFPGEHVLECVTIRITRNADMAVQEDMAGDLSSQMEGILEARRISHCSRLEIENEVTRTLLSFLHQALQTNESNTYRIAGPLGLKGFFQLTRVSGFEHLQQDTWPPQPSPQIDPGKSMFEILRRENVLLCHPFESFDPVIRLVEEAAGDPDVVAIKQILYRVGSKSAIVQALIKAARAGKSVTALVELKARFDEAPNIEWARVLERAGAQVIYGIKGLKTHAKICVVVRREPDGLRRYLHFGTGNYNESTATMYTDISYLTSEEDLGADASAFFNAISGYSQPHPFRKLRMAPIGIRDQILQLIEGEIARKKQGRKAHIMAKVNSLQDPQIIEALYRASQAGIKVQLNIRGICCLRPGVKGLSDNITVVSIVDRFLEHSRVMYFYHGGDEVCYLSSADWMMRNLDRRIELLVPVEDPAARERVKTILQTCMKDTIKGRRILSDGSYEKPAGGARGHSAQQQLYQQACDAIGNTRRAQRTIFEPHRPPDSKAG